MENPTLNSKD